MHTVHIRKQGGAAIITIPAHILTQLHLSVGTELSLNIDTKKHSLVIKPVAAPIRRKRKRYTLNELLKGCTPKRMKALMKETAWIREIKPVGREYKG